MSDRAVAGRYARALFDVVTAEPDGDPMAAQRDLEGFAALLKEHPALYQALANPAVPAARKQAAVTAVLGAQQLERYFATKLGVSRQEDFAHAALSQQAHDLEVVDHRAAA